MLWWTYQQLRMGSAKSRLAVVEKLATSHDEETVGPLIFALKDKVASVRCLAAKALMRFCDRRAVEPLIVMLRDPDSLARAAAAESLGRLDDPVAVNQLVGLLRDPEPIVRTFAARSLKRLGWRPGTDSQRMMQILAMGDLQQLAAFGPEGVAPLLELMRNGPPNKQFSAVKTLGRMNDPRIGPAMIEALHNRVAAVRIAALGALERLADPTAFNEVEKLLRDPDANVRGAAVEAAFRCGGSRAGAALVNCLNDTSWEVRQASASALGLLGEPSSVEGLCGLVNDPDRDVRETAIIALGQIGDRRAITPLVPALLSEDSSVRNAATVALQKLDRHWAQQDDIHQVVPKITKALKHPDYWVRYSAGKLLELLKIDPDSLSQAPVAVPEKMAMKPPPHPAAGILADLMFDRDRDLRLAAAAAMGRLRDKNTGSVLTAALRDTDAAVRQAVQEALAALN